MVFVRYVLNQNTIWQTDFVTYSLVAATFIGSPYVLLTRGHVNVDVLPLLPRRRARAGGSRSPRSLMSLAFCVVLTVLTCPFWLEAWDQRWVSDTMWRARLWIPYASMPIGLGAPRRCNTSPTSRALRHRARAAVRHRQRRTRMSPTDARRDRARRHAARCCSPARRWRSAWARSRSCSSCIFQGFDALHVVAETFYAGLNDFTLVSIPMFVMMGAAIGSSPAGKDLYEALDRWLYRAAGRPGDLQPRRVRASSPRSPARRPRAARRSARWAFRRCAGAAIPTTIATGSICAGGTLGILIPPSITFILYGIATETSIGRLFLAGVMPGLMLTGLFMLWTLFIIWKRGFRSHAADFRYTLEGEVPVDPEDRAVPRDHRRRHVRALRRRRDAVGGGGRGRGAVRGAARWSSTACGGRREWWQILRDTTRESVMILMIIARRGAVRLHADVALPHADARAGDRRDARQPLGADGADQRVPAGVRLLHPAGGDHPDDEPDPAADHHAPPASTRCGSA